MIEQIELVATFLVIGTFLVLRGLPLAADILGSLHSVFSVE